MNERVDRSERHLYLGTIPSNINTQFKYKGVMKVNEELPIWGSILGMNFIGMFNLSLFDYEKNKLSFTVMYILLYFIIQLSILI